MKTRFLLICAFVLGMASFGEALPPPPPPPDGGDEPGCWPPPCVPIDGGITLLIAAGAIYGGRKLYSKHKQQNPL